MVVFLLLFPPLDGFSATKYFLLSEAFLGIPGGDSLLLQLLLFCLRLVADAEGDSDKLDGFICPNSPSLLP